MQFKNKLHINLNSKCVPFPLSYLWGSRTVGSDAGELQWGHTTQLERRSDPPEKVKGQIKSE